MRNVPRARHTRRLRYHYTLRRFTTVARFDCHGVSSWSQSLSLLMSLLRTSPRGGGAGIRAGKLGRVRAVHNHRSHFRPVFWLRSQPMFRIRHPRHRTGVHTDAVNTSSGTPGPPIITAILDQPPGRAAERLAPPGSHSRFSSPVFLLTSASVRIAARRAGGRSPRAHHRTPFAHGIDRIRSGAFFHGARGHFCISGNTRPCPYTSPFVSRVWILFACLSAVARRRPAPARFTAT
jgi:hypothetical protein